MILSIDAGTQSIRASIIDKKGTICALVKTPVTPYFSKKAGWAEQNPTYYWEVFCATTKQLLKENLTLKKQLIGVTVTTQRGSVINVDKEGKPLRPAILWLDQRKAKMEAFPNWWLSTAMKGIGIYSIVEHAITECEANWIRQNEVDIWNKTHKFLFLSGYFHYKLTNRFIETKGNMVGYVPFDHKTGDWATKSDFKSKMFPIEESKLPELIGVGEVIGNITEKAANETDIPVHLPVISAASDKACELLGTGTYTSKVGCLSFGTTATFSTNIKKYKEVIPYFPPYTSAIKGCFNTEIMVYRGYWMVSWFKKEFGSREVLQAEELGIATESIFDEMIKDIPAGAMGLTLQPFWSPGIKSPGKEAKGSIIGFGDVHTKAHIYKAILEGIGYALRNGAEQTQQKTGEKITELRVSGGGSQSDEAMQLTANIFNLPTHRPHTFETSALGAAMLGFIGLGLHTYESAIKEMTHIKKTFYPNKKEAIVYNQLYKEVYQQMYPRLKPIYEKIQKITGYPKI
ncbi:FGGY-family carbohydrate kinase [Flammeovirga pectinis]|nr:FGGY-family carbohydrate kinase [Flammeovirga pectinis]